MPSTGDAPPAPPLCRVMPLDGAAIHARLHICPGLFSFLRLLTRSARTLMLRTGMRVALLESESLPRWFRTD